MRIADGKLCLYLPKVDKLKQSESSDLRKISTFTDQFRKAQRQIVPTFREQMVREHSNGDKVMVRISDFRDGKLYLETADPTKKKISGSFHHRKGLFYYTDADFFQAMNIGDTFMATLVDKDKGLCM